VPVQVQSIGLLSSAVEGFTTSGGRIKGEQCSLLCRSGHTTLGWESHESSQHACTPWFCIRSCSACRLHLFAIRLCRTQLGSGH